MEHRIQGAYTALDMGALYKAYGRVLKTRVSLQNERRQLEMSGVNSVRGAWLKPPGNPQTPQAMHLCTYLKFCSFAAPEPHVQAATAPTCREQRRSIRCFSWVLDPMLRWSPGPTKTAQYAAGTREHRAKTRSCRQATNRCEIDVERWPRKQHARPG